MTSTSSIFPKITIITSTFNCKNDLLKTINSVKSQKYPNVQWIIIDGLSTDGTVDLIKQHNDIIDQYISEEDSGIYDAWNKSFKFINGDWVIFLGAGDSFFNEYSLQKFWKMVPENYKDYVILYGNVMMMNTDDSLRYISKKTNLEGFEYGRTKLPNHQGVFQPSYLFNNKNKFDSSLKIAGDSKFMMKSLINGKYFHVNILVSKMQDLGVSNNINNVILANKEISLICKELKITIPIHTKLTNLFRIIVYKLLYKIFSKKVIFKLKVKYDYLRNKFS
jgi:glycosyltransferase involved in cell wall biosynthesis